MASIRIPFVDQIAQIRQTGQAAKDAAREVRELEKQLIETDTAGKKIEDADVAALNAARARLDEAKRISKQTRDVTSKGDGSGIDSLKRYREVVGYEWRKEQVEIQKRQREIEKNKADALKAEAAGREHFNEARSLRNYFFNNARAFAGGDTYEAARNLLFERDTQQNLKHLGMNKLAAGLKRAGPAAQVVDMVVQAMDKVVERRDENVHSKMRVGEMYARGQLSAEAHSKLMAKGSWYNDLNPIGDSAAQKREHMLATFNSFGLEDNLTADGRAKRMYFKRAVTHTFDAHYNKTFWENYRDQDLMKMEKNPARIALFDRNNELLNRFIKETDSEVAAFRGKYGYGNKEKEASIGAEIASKITHESPLNWWFTDALKDWEEQAKAEKVKEDRKNPRRPESLTDKAEREGEVWARKSSWNEYKKGYVPFNNVE